MSRQFPPRPEIEGSADQESLVLELDDDAADEVFETLSAKTTRRLFVSLYDEPATISQLAAEHETTLQNVQYHIEKLREAGLIEVRGTWYSERGSEMKVYAPTSESLVLFAGEEESKPTLQRALARLFGAVSLLGVVGFLVQFLADRFFQPEPTERVGFTSEKANVTSVTVDTGTTRGPFEQAVEAVSQFLHEPGGLVFGVGCVVLLVLFGLWYTHRYGTV